MVSYITGMRNDLLAYPYSNSRLFYYISYAPTSYIWCTGPSYNLHFYHMLHISQYIMSFHSISLVLDRLTLNPFLSTVYVPPFHKTLSESEE